MNRSVGAEGLADRLRRSWILLLYVAAAVTVVLVLALRDAA